jgi:tRNA U34 2-thiouridine synthase MnmA/TrmU
MGPPDSNSTPRTHVISLFSGGLDSCLSVLLMLRQNVRVTALTMMTHFGCDLSDRSSCSSNPYPVAAQFGFDVKLVHLAEKFVKIVQNPVYGYGKNMNPCVDCRILMLREAKEYMDIIGADAVITGEVLGQRPFSQMRPRLDIAEREAGLKGRLLRPLSARLLNPTIPELEGKIDREQLESISGRSRQRQFELAKEFGLEDFPSPASGCLLTDPGYSRRLRDLLTHNRHVDFTDLNLLQVGRHFRLSPNTKAIVGRNETENAKIRDYTDPHDWQAEVMGTGSPVTVVRGAPTNDDLERAAAITARYCDLKQEKTVEVTLRRGSQSRTVRLTPANPQQSKTWRV